MTKYNPSKPLCYPSFFPSTQITWQGKGWKHRSNNSFTSKETITVFWRCLSSLLLSSSPCSDRVVSLGSCSRNSHRHCTGSMSRDSSLASTSSASHGIDLEVPCEGYNERGRAGQQGEIFTGLRLKCYGPWGALWMVQWRCESWPASRDIYWPCYGPGGALWMVQWRCESWPTSRDIYWPCYGPGGALWMVQWRCESWPASRDIYWPPFEMLCTMRCPVKCTMIVQELVSK